MLFSSLIFLYLFLPVTLLGYYLINKNYRNYWLLGTSLVFFAWGGVSFTIILIASIVFNYIFGLLISKNIDNKNAKRWLSAGVTVNVLLLAVFKYANFLIANINELLDCFSIPFIPQTNIALPIGISFYTFHSLSYLVDIYKRKTTVQRNLFDLSLYISMFSQLIAGPIIRYSDISTQLRGREHTLEKFSYGVERFLIGLGKKVLLANTFARVADDIFALDPSTLGFGISWLGIICYTLQIYCDFAGYSDMAIGLGKMFGFDFKENFNFPYIAKSVKEFWRRWHISLSTFFRDYVYIPLGGNRVSVSRTYVNLIIVFFLTGFWHGASWNFVVWGLFYGLFMIIERVGFDKILDRTWKPVANIYTMLVVIFAWVLFRADTLSYATRYWGEMLSFSNTNEQKILLSGHLNIELITALIIAIAGSLGLFSFIEKYLNKVLYKTNLYSKATNVTFQALSIVFYASIFFLCSLYLAAGTYNPFIYYRF